MKENLNQNEVDEHEDFKQPGINLLTSYQLGELKKVDPRSLFSWTDKVHGCYLERWVSRSEYIRLRIEDNSKKLSAVPNLIKNKPCLDSKNTSS